MLDNLLNIIIVSRQQGVDYKNKAKSVKLSGENGEMGILYGHSQLLSTIPPEI
jgi:F0F1-type ATP synthase epsilon subunit